MLRLFVGFDRRETVAAHVAAFSAVRRASQPISVSMLMLRNLPLMRERDENQSTDFAYSRFLVPWLCGYKGFAVFVDCDVLCRSDIVELMDGIDDSKAVSVVKHDYTPKHATKFLGHTQTIYKRKNWSSVMVFNNEKCQALTLEYVNRATGLTLHQFKWLDDGDIGELDPAWNHLVGEYDLNPDAKIVHFTLGTPCFAKYRKCEFSEEWHEELDAMLYYDRHGEYSRPERNEA